MNTHDPAVERRWTGSSAEVVHADLPPHGCNGFTSSTPSGTIGTSFSGHRRAVARMGGDAGSVFDIRPGSVFVSSSGAIEWLQVSEPAEALEIRLHPGTIAVAADGLEAPCTPALVDAAAVDDVTVWALCAQMRSALLSEHPVDGLAMDALVHALARHAVVTYGGISAPKRGSGKLSAPRLRRVADFIDAGLHGPIALADLARVACLSVFHFSRAFRNSTGLPPHRFVAARRMQRARQMLACSNSTIEHIAWEVGYASVPHFRDCFRAHFGVAPSRAREQI